MRSFRCCNALCRRFQSRRSSKRKAPASQNSIGVRDSNSAPLPVTMTLFSNPASPTPALLKKTSMRITMFSRNTKSASFPTRIEMVGASKNSPLPWPYNGHCRASWLVSPPKASVRRSDSLCGRLPL